MTNTTEKHVVNVYDRSNPMFENTTYTPVRSSYDEQMTDKINSVIPRIPLNMRAHKVPIGITAGVIFFSNGIIPILLYFVLKYGAKTSNSIAITVPSVLFGVPSIYTMFARLFSLLRPASRTRPIGATRRHLDFFQYNFNLLFVVITAMISASSALAAKSGEYSEPWIPLHVMPMALSVIIACVSVQLVVIWIVMTVAPNTTYFCRISSMAKGERLRSATYTIVEDVVAVDGKQGTEYRRALDRRYRFSEEIRDLFKWADAVWGVTGLAMAVVVIVLIWTLKNPNVGFVLGWIVPFVWAGVLIPITINRTKKACRMEESRYLGNEI